MHCTLRLPLQRHGPPLPHPHPAPSSAGSTGATPSRFFTAFGATEILLFFPDKIITVRQNDNSKQFCCLGVDAVGRIIIAAAKEIVVKQQVGEEQDVLGKVEQLQLQVAGLEELIRQLVKKIEKLTYKTHLMIFTKSWLILIAN